MVAMRVCTKCMKSKAKMSVPQAATELRRSIRLRKE